jgi:hypothetical protein
MKPIKDILNEIVKHLETVAVNLGAMEEALVGRQLISSGDIDNCSLASQQNAKHALVNVRYMISKLPD